MFRKVCGKWAAAVFVSAVLGITTVASPLEAMAAAPAVIEAESQVQAVIEAEAQAPALADEGSAASGDGEVRGPEGFVRDLYINVLGREPDSEGFDEWVSKLKSGEIEGAKLAYGFIFSLEYLETGAEDGEFVDMLYRAILGREADEGGKAMWLRNLNWGGTRRGVFQGFVNSREYAAACNAAGFNAGSYKSLSIYDENVFMTGFVKRMYTECLRREPDDDGWESWIGALLNGTSGASLAKGFFESQEFTAANYSDGDYVERLYRTMLDRGPDEGGFATWKSALASGATRRDVLRGFVESREFTALCEQYNIVRGTIRKVAVPSIHEGTNIFYDQDGPIVVIDAGHQSKQMTDKEPNGPGSSVMKIKVSSGAEGRVTGVPEYKLNLAVSLKLRDELLARGYSVVMIRETNNVRISNMERAQIANSYDTAVYIRVHANDVDNTSVNGVLTICTTKKNPYVPGMYKENHRLSQIIVDSVSEATGAKNTGIWETDEMTGSNWSKVPTTILEMGYMSNAAEDRRMQEESYQYKIVNGVADGIDEFLGR